MIHHSQVFTGCELNRPAFANGVRPLSEVRDPPGTGSEAPDPKLFR